jgi:hypothetical protein
METGSWECAVHQYASPMAANGAHLLFQIRVQALNYDLHATFKHWYPYLQHRQEEELAAKHTPNFRLLSCVPIG